MPNLIILRGPIGAGKTSLMHSLANTLPNTSVIEVDALKRMFDSHASTDWRREAAFSAALYMAKRALSSGRNVIAETHSKRPEQQKCFKDLVREIPSLVFKSVLVIAPLNVCIERSKQRFVPDISYDIDERMVKSYYVGLEPLPDEIVVDTSSVSPQLGAEMILETLMEL
jgi:predicted kinase